MAANPLSNNISSPSGSTTGNRTVDAADQVSTQVRNQQMTALTWHAAIFWDIETCQVPAQVDAEDVAGNIRDSLQRHEPNGAVTFFSAYGDFNESKKIRAGCQRTGVNLIDVPSEEKDAADKAILVDMVLFALDNPPPYTILLISGDVDFAPALHKLGQRGYTVVLAIPSRTVSKALYNAGRFVWDWPSIARGEGPVRRKLELACYRCFSSEDSDVPNDETYTLNSTHRAADLSRIQLPEPSAQPSTAIPRRCSSFPRPSSSFAQNIIPIARPSSTPINVSKSLPGSLFTDAGSSGTSSDTSLPPNSTPRVQPGDTQGLEGQLLDFVNTAGRKKHSHPSRGKGRRGGGRGRQYERIGMAANPLSNNISSPSGSTTGNRTVDAADQVSTQVRNQQMVQEANALQKDSETEMEDSELDSRPR